MPKPPLITSKVEANRQAECVRRHMASATATAHEWLSREGWKSLGYSTEAEGIAAEFPFWSQIFAKSVKLGAVATDALPRGMTTRPDAPILRLLGKLPRAQRADAWQQAMERSRTNAPSLDTVRAVVYAMLPNPSTCAD